MIRLDKTTTKLEGVLNDTGADVIFTVSWFESTQESADNQPTRGATTITASNGTTDVTIAAAPLINVTKNIDYICVYNGNAATRIVTIQIDDGGTNRIQVAISLATTESAVWTPGAGWTITT